MNNRLRKAAESVLKDELRAMQKIVLLTGKTPQDRMPGYRERLIMLDRIKKTNG